MLMGIYGKARSTVPGEMTRAGVSDTPAAIFSHPLHTPRPKAPPLSAPTPLCPALPWHVTLMGMENVHPPLLSQIVSLASLPGLVYLIFSRKSSRGIVFDQM